MNRQLTEEEIKEFRDLYKSEIERDLDIYDEVPFKGLCISDLRRCCATTKKGKRCTKVFSASNVGITFDLNGLEELRNKYFCKIHR